MANIINHKLLFQYKKLEGVLNSLGDSIIFYKRQENMQGSVDKLEAAYKIINQEIHLLTLSLTKEEVEHLKKEAERGFKK